MGRCTGRLLQFPPASLMGMVPNRSPIRAPWSPASVSERYFLGYVCRPSTFRYVHQNPRPLTLLFFALPPPLCSMACDSHATRPKTTTPNRRPTGLSVQGNEVVSRDFFCPNLTNWLGFSHSVAFGISFQKCANPQMSQPYLVRHP